MAMDTFRRVARCRCLTPKYAQHAGADGEGNFAQQRLLRASNGLAALGPSAQPRKFHAADDNGPQRTFGKTHARTAMRTNQALGAPLPVTG